MADATVNITVPSIVAIEFQSNQELYLGFCAMSIGVGMTFGPVIGALIFGWVGYVNTFYFFAGFIAVLGGTCIFFLPSRLNNSESASEQE